MSKPPQRFTHDDYTVGWICALPKTELVAAAAMLDEEHQALSAADLRDENAYVLGRIGDHNVVIACLPAECTGKVNAATVAKDMLRSFPAVRFGLMVGVGGGAPYYGENCGEREDEDSEDDLEEIRDIRLGDVIISLHSKSSEAVVQYDFGKSIQEKEFVHAGGKLNKPPAIALTTIAVLQQQHERKGNKIPELLAEALSKNSGIAEKFAYPVTAKDRLFKANIVHVEGRKSCKACCGPDNINLVRRPDRHGNAPRIHYGTIGSADQVVKDAVLRDNWAQKESILCFEMEAAGLMDSFPCLVIRGVCDYADSHKNKIWQPYAAATAASYAKELLLVMPGQGVTSLPPVRQVLANIEENTMAIRREVLSSREEQFRDKILSWISPLDYSAKQNDTIARRTPGTGTWLLESSRSFNIWLNAPKQTLYCTGIPGAGKTILASIVIEHLQQLLYNKNAGIAYIYCTYYEQYKAKDLIACLLKQLTAQLSFVPEEVKKLYDVHGVEKMIPHKDLVQILSSITSNFPRVFIVVDALDECQDDDNRAHFLGSLKEIQPWVNIFVTSRPIASISESFDWALRETITATNEDISAYVEAEIGRQSFTLSRELTRDPAFCSSIVKQIVAKAEGMFLHAQFHVKYLAPKYNIRDLREALKELPMTSSKIYENAMERVQTQHVDTVALAKKILMCVIGAARPLSVQEIQHALAVREGDRGIHDEALTPPSHLLSVCAGLLTIDEQSNIIRLVHYTAQEYFKGNEYKYFPRAHMEIASICLRYLTLEVFGEGYCSTRQQYQHRIEEYALLQYATKNLGRHLIGQVEPTVIQLAIKFFLNKQTLSSATQVLLRHEWGFLGGEIFPRNFYAIHYASYMGHVDVIHLLFANCKVDVDSKDSWGRTPLLWAAINGHEAVVNLLLETGLVGVDSKDSWDRTPLLWAAINGHEAVVKLLLDTGLVDVDSKDSWGRTPLLWAAINGHEAVVNLLLETGLVGVDSKDSWDRTPLLWAAINGHEAVFKLLLETGQVDISIQDSEYGETPLLWAAESGHEAVVKLLLETGQVDVNFKGSKYGETPLLYAARGGHEAVVKLLLDTGQVDMNYSTPLSWAARNGHAAVVKLLLATGQVDVSKDPSVRKYLSRLQERGVLNLLPDTPP